MRVLAELYHIASRNQCPLFPLFRRSWICPLQKLSSSDLLTSVFDLAAAISKTLIRRPSLESQCEISTLAFRLWPWASQLLNTEQDDTLIVDGLAKTT
jgi:hypothetical protein